MTVAANTTTTPTHDEHLPIGSRAMFRRTGPATVVGYLPDDDGEPVHVVVLDGGGERYMAFAYELTTIEWKCPTCRGLFLDRTIRGVMVRIRAHRGYHHLAGGR